MKDTVNTMPNRFGTSQHDVAILGGGPAGSAAAITLASHGLNVALVSTDIQSPRVGETLPPIATTLLERLGVLNDFYLDSHLQSPGILTMWGDSTPNANDFILNPNGPGWHLDRSKFDEMLLRCAESLGTRVLRKSRVCAVRRTDDAVWHMEYRMGGHSNVLSAKFAIDATGRAAFLARACGAKRFEADKLIGIIGFGECTDDTDCRTFLEATPNGWWYSARLPNQRVVSAFMTDSDLMPSGIEAINTYWTEQFCNSCVTARLWGNSSFPAKVHLKKAGTAKTEPAMGFRWAAAGEAAISFDPLSSQGIMFALDSGCQVAHAVIETLDGSLEALREYTAWLDTLFDTYHRNYFRHYAIETRWPDSVFWGRRIRSQEASM